MQKLLYLRAHSLTEWRELSQTTHKAQTTRLLKQAKSYDSYLPPAEHPRDSITYIGMAVANMALAHLLTEEKAYLNTMRNWIKVGIGYPHWGLARKPDHDLDAAWLLFGLGIAYSWVGDTLPEDERHALREKLILQGTRIYNYALATEGKYWGSAYWQNHNWICYGGLATAAAALLEEHTDAQIWLDRAVENFKIVLPFFPEDGSDYEGVVYWRYGFPWLLIPAHLLQEECDVDLHDSEFLRQSFHHRLHLSGPNLIDNANFGDCHDRRSAHSRMVLYRLASLYRIGEAQWLANHFEEIGEWEREGKEGLVKPGLLPEAWLDFVWYDPTVEPKPIADLEKTAVFPDMGLLTTRSSWQEDATYLAFKCGTPNGARGWHLGKAIDHQNDWDIIKASHEHPDENSFILMRGADYLSVDPGYSKNKLTRNHSTILVDGKGQYNEGGYNAYDGIDEAWGGRLQDWFIAPNFTYVCGEAAGAYAPELQLTQYRRQMMMLGDDLFFICDDLRSPVPHQYQWLLQTDTTPTQTAVNQFTYQTDGSQMVVTAVSPNALTHQIHEIEITANPTSAKPDWIIRRTQHTLELSPAEPMANTRFFVVLDLANPDGEAATVEPLACEGGTAVKISKDNQTFIAAFANGRSRLVVPELLSTDADWVVANLTTGEFSAGGMTNLWIEGELQGLANTPIDIALRDDGCVIESKHINWISLRQKSKMSEFSCNGKPTTAHPNPALDLTRVQIDSGSSHISWEKNEMEVA